MISARERALLALLPEAFDPFEVIEALSAFLSVILVLSNQNILSSGGSNDNLGSHWCDAHFATGVSIFTQFALKELV